MKIKFNSDDELPINKTVEIPTITTVVRSAFYENKKCYPQFFLHQCDKIDVSEVIDVNKTSGSKECDIYHY